MWPHSIRLEVGKKWYIDSGCSRHVIGDHNKFISIKEIDEGKVNLGNNVSSHIIGKGIVNIDNGRTKDQNVLYIEVLKHNLLRISQMCDKGFDVILNSKSCEIENVDSSKLVSGSTKMEDTIYPRLIKL